MSLKRKAGFFWPAAVSLIVFLTQLSNPLAGGHSDEPLYIGIAREMMKRREWIIPTFHGAPAFYKPPLVYWMMILGFKVFGYGLGPARLPSALCGAAAVMLAVFLSKELFGEKEGDLAGWLAATSIPGMYAFSRAALLDVPLLLFIGLSLYCGLCAVRRKSPLFLGLSFFLIGICSLFKGPVGSLMAAIPLGFLLFRTKAFPCRSGRSGEPASKAESGSPTSSGMTSAGVWIGALLGAGAFFFWPAAVARRGFANSWFHFFVIQENFGKFARALDQTTRPTPGSVIWIHLFSQMLPWSFFLPAAFVLVLCKKNNRTDAAFFLLLWIFTVVFIFLMPEKKLSHYTLPALLPCCVLTAGIIRRHGTDWPARTACSLTGLVFGLCAFFLLLIFRAAGSPLNQFLIVCASLCFAAAAWWSFQGKLRPAAAAVSAFLFIYAFGLPRLMSSLSLANLKPLVQNQLAYSYHLDLGILGTALDKEISPLTAPGTAAHPRGILILRQSDEIDFLHSRFRLSKPLLAWESWKDHIRMLDILQAALSGRPQLIREQIVAVKIEG